MLVKAGSFRLDKATFDRLHALVAREEPLESGYFRGEGEFTDITPRVGLGYEGEFVPSHPTEPGAKNLKKLFADAVQALEPRSPIRANAGWPFSCLAHCSNSISMETSAHRAS